MRLNDRAMNADVMTPPLQAILAAYPACALLRRHPTPPPRQFKPLLAAASAAGFSLDVSTSRVQPVQSSVLLHDAHRNCTCQGV
jgi:exoribonuclease R